MSSTLRLVLATGSALAVLAATGCKTPSPAPSAEAPAPTTTPAAAAPLTALTYEGNQSALVALDREIAAAGRDTAKLSAIAARLLADLQAPSATFAARQAICQRLSELPAEALTSDAALRVFGAMLDDEKQLNLARLAVERVPGQAVDSLFLDALRRSTPANRLALVQSAGNRRLSAAVPTLAGYLAASEPAGLADAAAKALGQMGTPDALAALDRAPAGLASAVEARLTAAHQIGGAAAVATFQTVADDTHAPAALRASAYRGLITADPSQATARVLAALAGDDTVLKPVVIEALADLPSADLVGSLSAKLPSFDAPTAAAVISALGRHGDPAAVPAIVAATRHSDAEVRAAAITALGRLPGNADVVLALARLAAGDGADDAKLARQSLARLNGPGVADAILAGARDAEPAVRAALLESFASRNLTEVVPLLLETRAASDASVRSAALASLADLAPATAQSDLVAWAVAATDPAEQSRALRALANVTLRNPDTAGRARAVVEAIEQAPSTVAVRLLPVLPRIGGSASAECAARLALRDDPALAAAAVNALARWSDATGLDSLVAVVAKTSSDRVRASALDQAVRLIERSRDLPSKQLTPAISGLLTSATDPAVRLKLVRLLSRASDSDALALATRLQQEPALAAEAADTVLAIRANQAGKPTPRTTTGQWALYNFLDGNPKTHWTVNVATPQFVQLDFHLPRPIHRVTLDETNHEENFPEHYEVFVTDDLDHLGAPAATGTGTLGKTVIDLPPGTRGRYLLIRQPAATEDTWWSITELLVD